MVPYHAARRRWMNSMTSPAIQDRTREHYDAHPFDALTEDDERHPRQVQPRPFLDFCDTLLDRPARVAEIGCGPGRATMFLTSEGHDVVAVDISESSLTRAARRAPRATFIKASNLALPLADETFDAVVSDGVIHHTPDAFLSLSENARILRGGGVLYLGVYNRRRYYYYLYTYLGPLIRWIASFTAGRKAHRRHAATHLLPRPQSEVTGEEKAGLAPAASSTTISSHPGQRSTRARRSRSGGVGLGLSLLNYDPSLGNVHTFVFRKQSARSLA